jgi:energy-coupling factor transporter transmembrane protein EcfT
MSGDIYLIGFLGNLIFWAIIIGGIVFFVDKIKGKLTKRIIGIFGWLIIAWSLFISFVYFAAVDWRLEFTHDNFKINYYQSDIDCERNFLLIKKYK